MLSTHFIDGQAEFTPQEAMRVLREAGAVAF